MKAHVNGHNAFRDQRNDTVKIQHSFSDAYGLNFIYLKLTPILIPKKKIVYSTSKGENFP